MKRPFLLGFFTLAFVVSTSLLCAKPPKERKQPTWKVPKQEINVVTAVNASNGTVNISHKGGTIKQDRHLRISAFTEIFVDGKKTTLAAIRVGMHVNYSLGMDSETVAHLEEAVEPPPPPTPVPSFPHKKR